MLSRIHNTKNNVIKNSLNTLLLGKYAKNNP